MKLQRRQVDWFQYHMGRILQQSRSVRLSSRAEHSLQPRKAPLRANIRVKLEIQLQVT